MTRPGLNILDFYSREYSQYSREYSQYSENILENILKTCLLHSFTPSPSSTKLVSTPLSPDFTHSSRPSSRPLVSLLRINFFFCFFVFCFLFFLCSQSQLISIHRSSIFERLK